MSWLFYNLWVGLTGLAACLEVILIAEIFLWQAIIQKLEMKGIQSI